MAHTSKPAVQAGSSPASMLAMQIVQAAVRPDMTVGELVSVCQLDPAFVVHLLARVNSGRYALRNKVATVGQGVSLLGVRGIRNLALAVAIADLAPKNPDGDAMLALCLRRAIASRLVAQKLGKTAPEDYFTAGMLVETGILSRAREDFRTATMLARSPAAMRVMLERGRGAEDHARHGGQLALNWGLDQELSQAIAHHHDAEPPQGDVSQVVWLAERIAGVVEGGDISQCRNEAIAAAAKLKLTAADTDEILSGLPPLMLETASELSRNLGPQPDINELLRDANVALVEINRSYADLVLQLEQLVKERERLADELRDANEKLAGLAMTDPLTGMANRRHFDEALERDLARTERQGGALTLVIVDADHFKKVNDTYGHHGGDIVLKAIAAVLKESTRASDVAARVGGEEFALILPQTSCENALVVAERVRARVAERKITHDDGRLMKASVSVGVACVTAPGCRGRDKALFEAADRALYAAKSAGRNNVKVGKVEG
jgi:diguanylate cyclase (GGDEF)-like protein